MALIWTSNEDTGPYGSFPQYPGIETDELPTPVGEDDPYVGSFTLLSFDRLLLPEQLIINVPSPEFPTIQSAIDRNDGRGPINTLIVVAPGTYYESLQLNMSNPSSDIPAENTPQFRISGDVRKCAGLTYTRIGTNTNLSNDSIYGCDGNEVNLSFTNNSVQVIIIGECNQLDFVNLGVIVGDTIMIRDGDTMVYQRNVSAVSYDTITFFPDIPEFDVGEGTSVTICPNTVVVPNISYIPGVNIVNSSVVFEGICFRTDSAVAPFIPHLLRSFRSFVSASRCMFDDFGHCTYDDCVCIHNSTFSTRSEDISTHVTIAGGFTNSLLVDNKSLLDAQIISVVNSFACHGVSVANSSTAKIISLTTVTNNSAVQLFVTDASSAVVGNLSAFGNFMGVLSQNSSSVRLGDVLKYDHYPTKTVIKGYFLIFGARNGSNYTVDGGYATDGYMRAYLSGHSSATFGRRYYIDYTGDPETDDQLTDRYCITKGSTLTIQNPMNGNHLGGSAFYSVPEWRMFKSAFDNHIINAEGSVLIQLYPNEDDYMGNYTSLGRIYTVTSTSNWQHGLFLGNGNFYGSDVDLGSNMVMFDAADQFVTFTIISDQRTLIIASYGVTFGVFNT